MIFQSFLLMTLPNIEIQQVQWPAVQQLELESSFISLGNLIKKDFFGSYYLAIVKKIKAMMSIDINDNSCCPVAIPLFLGKVVGSKQQSLSVCCIGSVQSLNSEVLVVCWKISVSVLMISPTPRLILFVEFQPVSSWFIDLRLFSLN